MDAPGSDPASQRARGCVGRGVAETGLAPNQKKARRLGAEILFVDEAGFGFLTRPATTWAPKGQTPRLRRTSGRRVVSSIIALTLSGRIFRHHVDRGVKGEDVVAALKQFKRNVPGPIIILWDRLPAHRSAYVKRYVAGRRDIFLEEFPPYAPDLNPEELCHGHVKQQLRNATPRTAAQIRRLVDRGFAQLRRRPDVLLGFIRHAGLRVKQLW